MAAPLTLPDGWFSVACPDRHAYHPGNDVGDLCGVVYFDPHGKLTAEVGEVVGDEDTEERATAHGFDSLDAAREWVETTIRLLTP
ncbi:hypothetical protein [Nocardia farcinica]|uniref:hypothetical protein n=1 Tax=Nocardia farcinica TaxID=37329 RepID=UPI0024590860|nr:hypothetical protein [Nocardia farcinica]